MKTINYPHKRTALTLKDLLVGEFYMALHRFGGEELVFVADNRSRVNGIKAIWSTGNPDIDTGEINKDSVSKLIRVSDGCNLLALADDYVSFYRADVEVNVRGAE